MKGVEFISSDYSKSTTISITTSAWENLVAELVVKVFENLQKCPIQTFTRVCRRWRKIFFSPENSRYWNQQFWLARRPATLHKILAISSIPLPHQGKNYQVKVHAYDGKEAIGQIFQEYPAISALKVFATGSRIAISIMYLLILFP